MSIDWNKKVYPSDIWKSFRGSWMFKHDVWTIFFEMISNSFKSIKGVFSILITSIFDCILMGRSFEKSKTQYEKEMGNILKELEQLCEDEPKKKKKNKNISVKIDGVDYSDMFDGNRPLVIGDSSIDHEKVRNNLRKQLHKYKIPDIANEVDRKLEKALRRTERTLENMFGEEDDYGLWDSRRDYPFNIKPVAPKSRRIKS